jgi:hypothetical protein
MNQFFLAHFCGAEFCVVGALGFAKAQGFSQGISLALSQTLFFLLQLCGKLHFPG